MSGESRNAFLTEASSDIKVVVENFSDDPENVNTRTSAQLLDESDQEDAGVLHDTRPISAIAPKATHQDDSQVEVSSTPAFQCLDELFQNGKLTGTQVAQLKAKYIELHETLKKSRDNEAKLLKQVKDSLRRLDDDKEIMEKAEQFPDNLSNLSNEVLKLRAQYLKYNNDYSCFEEREYDLNYKIAGLLEDKKILEREYARMPKAHELERRIQELELSRNDLAREIKQRNEEIKDLLNSISDKKKENEIKAKELKEILDTIENKKSDYVVINTVPNQIIKEADKISMENDELTKEKNRIDSDYKQLYNNYQDIEAQRQDLEDKKVEIEKLINKQKNVTFIKEKDYNDLHKQLELEKEKETVLLADKATLEISLRHSLAEKKLEYEGFLKAQKEKEKEFKNCKKAELQLKTAQDSLGNVKLSYEKVMAKKEQQPLDDGSLFEQRKEIAKEVDQLKKSLTQQQSLTAIEKVKVEKCIEEEEHLLCEQSDYRVEAVEVTRLAAIKSDEREQKAREHMKAETRYKRAIEDLKTKDIIIEDNRKKYRELKTKIREHAKMYDIIKNERNKTVNKIQICTQRAAEMREKIKILQNEIEILRTSLAHKEKRLQKQHLKYSNAIVLRDSVRNEVSKEERLVKDLEEIKKQQEMNISNYNALNLYNEKEAVKLRKRYDEAVKSRNERGIEVITRGEEFCVVCERLNVQETMLKNANTDLQAKEEEIRFLRLQSNEEKRQITLLEKEIPSKEALDEELKTLQTQLTQCQNRLIELETQLQNSDNLDRINFLDGKDESPEQIMKKLETLENKLSIKEEQCLEKDLILEQVCRLTDRITNKVENSKEDTLSLAKNVNDIQARIKDVTRKMMATVSELSIAQAQALMLQEEVKTKELELEQCYVRMEKGEAPSEEMEREWLRIIFADERHKQDKLIKQSEEEELKQHLLPGGIYTTAEPRPNAYIPQEDNELPIPRPYGKLAPFKPTEKGSQMRHIKKPNPKPIEI